MTEGRSGNSRNLAFLLGVVGLSGCTLEFAFSSLTQDSTMILLIAAIWVLYLVIGLDLRNRDRSALLGLGLGLIVLILPPIYMMSYDSVSRTRNVVVSATRTFSPANDSVTLDITVEISSSFNLLPVTISDLSYGLWSSGYQFITGLTVSGGTFYPFGHLRYDLIFAVGPRFVDGFRGNITSLYLFCDQIGTIRSGLFSGPFSPCWVAHWDWTRNTPCFSNSVSSCP